MFHLTPQGRALAGIGIVVSIIALMTLCCVVFYLCLTHPETTGTRDGDAEYAKAREHWHEKQRRRKEARKASKERKRRAKLQKKMDKRAANPDHRHNKCACNESSTLELARQCNHASPASSREFELDHFEQKTYVNLDYLKPRPDNNDDYESVYDRNDSLYEVYFTAPERTYRRSADSSSSSSTDAYNVSSAPTIPERKSNVTFEIGSSSSSIECLTIEPDYDNTSYLGPPEHTAIEPSRASSVGSTSASIQLFRTALNTAPNPSDGDTDSLYDVIRKPFAPKLNSTFHGFPAAHTNDAYSDSSSCGINSLPR